MPIPLADPDPDVRLDLQQQFTLVYDRAGYDYALDYEEPPHPPLEPTREKWLREIIETAQRESN